MSNFVSHLFALVFGLCLSLAGFVPAAATTATVTFAPSPEAQSQGVAAPYLTNKKGTRAVDVLVLGDSLAEGLFAGLKRLIKGDDRLTATKMARVNTGLVRSDRYDWNKQVAKLARAAKHDAAIIVIGINDRQTFRRKGPGHHFQQDNWETLYAGRIDGLITDLKQAGIAVYWVGIPVTAARAKPEELSYLNGFYERAASRNGIRYIDTWTPLADDRGDYTPFWRDESGRKSIIRANDGVHFTPSGYSVFASFVHQALLADIAAMSDAASRQDDGEDQSFSQN